MAISWKAKTICRMTKIGMLGCHCPIKVWNRKEMFIAHWQIYHIDQHTVVFYVNIRKKMTYPLIIWQTEKLI